MHRLGRNFALATLSALLAACSGNSSAPSEFQSKQLQRNDKSLTAASYQNVLEQLYVAYYGRPADPAGMAYWEGVLLAANAPTTIAGLNAAYTTPAIKAIVDSFGNSAESQSLYGSGNSGGFINAIYQNVLDRSTATDTAGAAYWQGLLTSGAMTQAQAALAILSAAATEPTTSTDEQVVANRLAVANYFTAQVTAQSAASVYSGNVANVTVRTMLGTVMAGTDPVAFEANVSTTLQALLHPAPNLAVLAGNIGSIGSADGAGSAARFSSPHGVTLDTAGNAYVADTANNTIRKIAANGTVTTLAGQAGVSGNADGTGSAARFNMPYGIAVDSAGNVYVADTGNNAVRMITPGGVVTTLGGASGNAGSQDGVGPNTSFNGPLGIAVDSTGNIYVADSGNNTIRRITPSDAVSTVAGTAGVSGSANGKGSGALFNTPIGLAIDASNNLYIADAVNGLVREMTPTGVVTTVVNYSQSINSSGTAVPNLPYGVAIDANGYLYVSYYSQNIINKISSTGSLTTLTNLTIANSANSQSSISNFAYGVALDVAGNLFVADSANNLVRKISLAGAATTVAGNAPVIGSADGLGSMAAFSRPQGVAADSAGNVYVADTYNNTIRKISSSGAVTTLAGMAGVSGHADGTGAAASFNLPRALTVDAAGNVYVSDSGNNTIRKITPAGAVTTLAGFAGYAGSVDGTGVTARFSQPLGIAVDTAGNVYVADSSSNIIRKITSTGTVSTLAGNKSSSGSADGTGPLASFNVPTGLAIDSNGNLYVADTNNNTIREISPAGVVVTLAGKAGKSGFADRTGSAAQFNQPYSIAIDSAGNVYVADLQNYRIRQIAGGGVVTTLAGTQTPGFVAGALPGGLIDFPGIAVGNSTLYIIVEQGIAALTDLP